MSAALRRRYGKARALVRWKDDWKQKSSEARLGTCFMMIFWPDAWRKGYHVYLSPAGAEKIEFVVEEWRGGVIAPDNRVTLDQAKLAAFERARELGCKRERRTRVRDEDEQEWLTKVQAEVLEQIENGQRIYEREEEHQRKWPTKRQPYESLVTTGYLPAYFEQHYLGSGRTSRELTQAVGLVLGRLERAGKIESMTLDRQRYWSPIKPG